MAFTPHLQFAVGQTLSSDRRSKCDLTLVVSVESVIKGERALVNVAKVVRVGSVPRSLAQVPEGLKVVRMNIATDDSRVP